MCGIAGILAYGEEAPRIDPHELLRIREAMSSRGPDGAGLWTSPDARVGLAHRRLAIIDLTSGGAQPMATTDGRLRITFNGEIYNYLQLKRELEAKGHRFHSNSDTEVLLHLYDDRGARMVDAIRGMYAFAIWDERNQLLFLARDPFGIKPLYYTDDGCSLRFASQVKALLKGGAVNTAPDSAGSVGFLIWGYVPEPYTLYRDIQSLPAGAFMQVPRSRRRSITRFFSISDELRRAEEAAPGDPRAAAGVIREAIAQTVSRHLVSDVPVGLFLSAGIDSSAIASVAAQHQGGNLRAMTLGFDEFRGTVDDEVPLAARVASEFGLDHRAEWIGRDDFASELDRIIDAMDQPSTDGVNTYLVSRAAAGAGMKVALSGIGGDELFGGYPSFRQVPRAVSYFGFLHRVEWFGRLARRALAPAVSLWTSPKYASLLEYGANYSRAYVLCRALFMPWELDTMLDAETVKEGLRRLEIGESVADTISGLRRPNSRIAALELSWYMRNQLLRDADWAGMAHSLEIRVPFVDVDLFRAMAPLMVSATPPTKQDLAASLSPPLPAAVLSRAKTGFTTPVEEWIGACSGPASRTRGLRGWARHVLPLQPEYCGSPL